MKRSLILMSICTGFGASLIHAGQTTAAATSAQAPAAATATPGRKNIMPSLFSAQESNAVQKHVQEAVEALKKQKTPARAQSPRVKLNTHYNVKPITAEERTNISQAIANQAQLLNPSRTTKFMNFLKKHRFGAIAGSAALICGLIFGQVKYKMISRMFKAAPVTPANAVKVSWLKALTGLSTR